MNEYAENLPLCTIYLNNRQYKNCIVRDLDKDLRTIAFYCPEENKEYFAIADNLIIEKNIK